MNSSELLDFLSSQTPETLHLIQEATRKLIIAKTPTKGFENVSVKMPSFGIAHYIFPIYLEAIFVAWAQEWSSNYIKDYGTKLPNSLNNDNSLVISNAYNDVIQQDGQFPRLVIKCGGISSSSLSMNDDMNGSSELRPPEIFSNHTETRDTKGCLLHSNIMIYIVSQNPNEANNIAGAAFGALLESRPVIRDVFNLQQISFPTLTTAAPVKDRPKIYSAQVQFNVMQVASWDLILKSKHYRNMIVKVCAVLKKEPTPAIEMIVGSFPLPISEDLRRRLEELS